MKLILAFAAIVTLAGTIARADTLNTGGGFNTSTGTLNAFNMGTTGSCTAGVCTDGTPFWNNTSSDVVNGSDAANAGDFLSGGGGFASPVIGCSTCGVDFMASGGQMYTQSADSPNFASAFSFINQNPSMQITLLYANSPTNNNAAFGIYDASSQANALANHTIAQAAGTNLNGLIGSTYNITDPYSTWGIFASTCDENAITGDCPGADMVTYYSNLSLNSGNTPAADAGHMHWALFQSGTNADVYYLALEDFAIQTGTRNLVEGYGDYNDIILEINTSSTGSVVPEPTTVLIMSLGLAGLAFCAALRRVRALDR